MRFASSRPCTTASITLGLLGLLGSAIGLFLLLGDVGPAGAFLVLMPASALLGLAGFCLAGAALFRREGWFALVGLALPLTIAFPILVAVGLMSYAAEFM